MNWNGDKFRFKLPLSTWRSRENENCQLALDPHSIAIPIVDAVHRWCTSRKVFMKSEKGESQEHFLDLIR